MNGLLSDEMTAVYQYMVHSEMDANRRYDIRQVGVKNYLPEQVGRKNAKSVVFFVKLSTLLVERRVSVG